MSWNYRYLEWRFNNLSEAVAFLLASLSLAVAFIPFYNPYAIVSNPIQNIIIPYVVALLAVIPHEIGHRQMARRYNCYSRFALSFAGFWTTLLFNLVGSFLHFLVFFSGYTAISCGFRSSTEIEGKTAMAGPLTNIILGFIGLIGSLFLPPFSLIGIFFAELASFNFWVAFFNLLPFWVLDGLKIFRWNVIIWGILILIAFVITFFVVI
ncbi:peptidase M50 [Sulfolobus sp. A20]|uniref:peptidase M50 n=1 Tax=Sulfolobaceae TaxID=118883 RepID=UPI00084606CE|nr:MULTISPECIES: peptidase M50 [unclassified Sulfolobus]TRM78532.1 site-2 protease family protein [Sulfolobus sp. A20-N-F8]TRM79260.1 site-2 protease family protein [Sulfolobus sp. B5]TRM80757.1 site-2 protease family protein [Sulfolobus sp. D5]TRM84429.1 site-2 protease family protein [Sulfolobus sp. F3]TRM88211.1 site-2 protease family protein [Sulfolobus sp. E3]TRM89835.1 site-2 protease family protein [Sulfolobus sp. C3]TRM95353.1 site-2 protease family protein [Sulfolobus sp. A20-N-G8]